MHERFGFCTGQSPRSVWRLHTNQPITRPSRCVQVLFACGLNVCSRPAKNDLTGIKGYGFCFVIGASENTAHHRSCRELNLNLPIGHTNCAVAVLILSG